MNRFLLFCYLIALITIPCFGQVIKSSTDKALGAALTERLMSEKLISADMLFIGNSRELHAVREISRASKNLGLFVDVNLSEKFRYLALGTAIKIKLSKNVASQISIIAGYDASSYGFLSGGEIKIISEFFKGYHLTANFAGIQNSRATRYSLGWSLQAFPIYYGEENYELLVGPAFRVTDNDHQGPLPTLGFHLDYESLNNKRGSLLIGIADLGNSANTRLVLELSVTM